ncbi:MAG: hypothetical protein IKH54_07665 [Bacilli bacterium]|nr:hypothetical protein [Bacilli bacterium]
MEKSKELEDKLLELLKRESSLEKVCEMLELNEYEALALVKYIQDSGINIVVNARDDDIYMINRGDFELEDNKPYEFHTDKNNEFKFVAIADTRFGSKYQQLSILNDIYEKADELGYKNVFLCGNISNGLYDISNMYSETSFLDDTQRQIDYILENYPKIDGMKTYLVNGKTDSKHLKKNITSIGKKLAEGRDDFVYLGNLSANVKIDNAAMQILAGNLGKTYTVSYRPQQQIDSYRSEDKPDILLMGGYLQMEKFTYRGVTEISVPSVCATTPKMNDRRYSNTVGAWYVTVKTDLKGNLLSVNAMSSPYYLTKKDDYKTAKVLKKGVVRNDK